MIERKFVKEKVKEKIIKNFIEDNIDKSSYSKTNILKTPLGMKIIIHSSKPGLIVGKGGQNIKRIQAELIKKFGFENPVVEVNEVKEPELDAQIMCERVSYQLTRWGVQRFKKIGYNILERIMKAGAKGGEVLISGKVPGKRASNWRFRAGYLPKNGAVSDYEVNVGFTKAVLQPGVIGIWVSILRKDVQMPDEVNVLDGIVLEVEKPKEGNVVPKVRKKVKIELTEVEKVDEKMESKNLKNQEKGGIEKNVKTDKKTETVEKKKVVEEMDSKSETKTVKVEKKEKVVKDDEKKNDSKSATKTVETTKVVKTDKEDKTKSKNSKKN